MTQGHVKRDEGYFGCRWTLRNLDVVGPLTHAGEAVEVMPVAEHEALREAAQEIIDMADSPRWGGNRPVLSLNRLKAALSSGRVPVRVSDEGPNT